MKTLKKCICFTIVLVLLAGLSTGCKTGTLFRKNETYESISTIILSTTDDEQASLSSGDLAVALRLTPTLATLLNSERVYSKINEKFPDDDFELTLEPVENTTICKIIVTGAHSENLENICNIATSLLCETVSDVMPGCSCRIVDLASKPTLLVESN